MEQSCSTKKYQQVAHMYSNLLFSCFYHIAMHGNMNGTVALQNMKISSGYVANVQIPCKTQPNDVEVH
jgi:hypothetical protein